MEYTQVIKHIIHYFDKGYEKEKNGLLEHNKFKKDADRKSRTAL